MGSLCSHRRRDEGEKLGDNSGEGEEEKEEKEEEEEPLQASEEEGEEGQSAGPVPKAPRYGTGGRCYSPGGQHFRAETYSVELKDEDI